MSSLHDTYIFSNLGENYITLIDYDASGNAIYQGWAKPGTASSASTWRIKKNAYDGSNQFTGSTFPSGSPAFAFVWDSRTTAYTYS